MVLPPISENRGTPLEGPGQLLQFAMNFHGALHESFCDSLSKELHRDVCQKLTAAKLELDILALDQTESEALERARSALSDSIKEIRELMEALAGHRK